MRLILQISLVGLVGCVSLIMTNLANSQTRPELIITWKTNNYVPSDYQGKALPISGTTINFALQLVDNNKLINLSNQEIRWYIGNNLFQAGAGLTNISYTIPLTSEESFAIRIVVPNYQETELNQFLTINLAQPEVVIDNSEASQLVPLPYFFNVNSFDQLIINWEDQLSSVVLRVQNSKNPLEIAQTSINK